MFSKYDFFSLSLQGARVWLREDEQHLPSTVSSCSGGVVVFATDYGQVRATEGLAVTIKAVTLKTHNYNTFSGYSPIISIAV